MKIINKQPAAFLKNLTKAYTEGIYADTPANRKLGRVGMTYAAYAEKIKKESSSKKNKELWDEGIKELLNNTQFLQELRGKKLDTIINYTHSDDFKQKKIEGIKVNKDATDEEKRLAITEYYAEQAENDGELLDEIVADIFDEIVEEKEEKIPLSSISVQGEDKYKFTTGKSPKGKGNWAFKIGNDDVDKDPSKIFFVEGMYEEAKNEAKKEAQKRGNVYSVTVLP